MEKPRGDTFIKNCPSSVSIIEDACGNCDGSNESESSVARTEIETRTLPTALLKEASAGVEKKGRLREMGRSLQGDTLLETGPVQCGGRRGECVGQ